MTWLKHKFHEKLVIEVFKEPLPDAEALSIMTLLHYGTVAFDKGLLEDAPGLDGLDQISIRDASACIGALWQRHNDVRREPTYWQLEWSSKSTGSITTAERVLIESLINRIKMHPIGPVYKVNDIYYD